MARSSRSATSFRARSHSTGTAAGRRSRPRRWAKPPAGPAGPRGFPVGTCRPPIGLPVLHPFPFARRLAPLPRRRRPAWCSFATLLGSVSGRWQPSPESRRVGLRGKPFGACSAFPRVPACALTEPPSAALFPRSASVHIVASVNRSDGYWLERQLPSGMASRRGTLPWHGARHFSSAPTASQPTSAHFAMLIYPCMLSRRITRSTATGASA